MIILCQICILARGEQFTLHELASCSCYVKLSVQPIFQVVGPEITQKKTNSYADTRVEFILPTCSSSLGLTIQNFKLKVICSFNNSYSKIQYMPFERQGCKSKDSHLL